MAYTIISNITVPNGASVTLPYTIGTGATWTNTQNTQASLHVKGEANFEGNVKVRGQDILESLQAIESRLAILYPNPELEEEFTELKRLGDEYRALEEQLLEKKRTWDLLKKTDQ